MPILHSLIAFSLAFGVAANAAEEALQNNVRNVILLDHSESGGHGPSRQYLRDALSRLSQQHGFQVRMTDDPSLIDEKTLSSFQVLILSNGDGDVIPTGAAREAVENFVKRDGKGLILVHSAIAFLKDWTFLGEAAVQPYYRHNEPGTHGRIFADSGNLGVRTFFEGLPRSFLMTEEYYSFRESPRKTPGVNVLYSLDENSVQKVASPTGDHPLVWTRKMGNGRVITQSLGHGKGFYTGADSFGQKLLWNELRYVTSDLKECVENCNAPTAISGPESGITTNVSVLEGAVRISLAEDREYTLRITGANGKTVYFQKIRGPRSSIRTRRFEPGTYVVHVQSGSFRMLRKVVLF